jgi:hypothetical protein
MKGEKAGKHRKEKLKKIRLIIWVGVFMFFSGMGLSRGNDWTLLPWGLNLEELNQAFKEKYKSGQIKEDKDRSEIEIQYAPAKSFKIRRGKIVALLSLTDPSTPGRLYGYAYEGKIFGRVIFFKDYPEFFPETMVRKLKEQYPQGKIIRNFSLSSRTPYFEYKSDQLYVFSTERGVFYYEPAVLEKVVRIELGQHELEEKTREEKIRDQSEKPQGPSGL